MKVQYKYNMGNICNNGNHEKEETTETVDTFNKNFPVCEFTIRKSCKLLLILGTYRYHRSETLLLITQSQYLEYCPELREYAQNYSAVLEQVTVQRKKLLHVSTSRNCPYKKVQVCILPAFNSNESQSYLQQFQNMVQEVLQHSSDLTLQLSYTSENLNGLPNQTLMAVFLRYISANVNKPVKIAIISSQSKLLNMVRYQVVKLENYVVNLFNNEIQL